MLFTIIGLSLYILSFDNELLLDDTSIFSETSFFNQVAWSKIFSTPYIPQEGRYYRPITTFLFKAEYTLFRDNLFPYHLLNIALHIINAYIVFIFVQTLSKHNNLSFLSALLFLIHPFSAETALTLIASSDMTAFMFFLLTLFFWMKDNELGRNIYKILAIICFTLALFTKETTLILLFVLVYIDFCKLGIRGIFKSYKKYLPFCFVVVVFLFIRFQVLSAAGKTVFSKHIFYFLLPRLITSLGLYIKYLGQFLLPINICSNIMIPINTNLMNLWFFIVVLFIGFLILIYIKAFKAKNILILFSLGYTAITMLPASNISPLYPFLTIKSTPYLYHVPRHLYLPSVGIFILLSYAYVTLVNYFSKKKIFFKLLLVFFIILFSITTIQKVSEYDNAIGFYRSITKRCSDNFWGHCFLAASLRRAGRFKEALEEIKISLKLQPQHHDIHKKMADIYSDLEEYEKAIQQYQESLKLKPHDYETYINLGITYNNMKQYEKALQSSYHAIDLNPTCSKAYTNIGNVYLHTNRIHEAEKALQKALELNPNNSEALLDLGIIYMKKERFFAAIDKFEMSLKVKPESHDVFPKLAECYMKVGEINKAISSLKAYLQYFPDDPATWNNMGICYAKLNQPEKARFCWEKVVSSNSPISSIAKDNLQRLKDK